MSLLDIDNQLTAKQRARIARENNFLQRITNREAHAESQIGQLITGRYYIWPQGGRYRESHDKLELVSFLIRNRYA